MHFGLVKVEWSIWLAALLCVELGVSRFRFHAWTGQGPSERAQLDAAFIPLISSSFTTISGAHCDRPVWRDVFGDGSIVDVHSSCTPTSCLRCLGSGRFRGVLASDQRLHSHRMSLSGCSRSFTRTANGSPTLPMSGRQKDGSTLRPSSLSSHAESSASPRRRK